MLCLDIFNHSAPKKHNKGKNSWLKDSFSMFNPDFSYFNPPPPFSIIQVYLAAPQVPPHGCFGLW